MAKLAFERALCMAAARPGKRSVKGEYVPLADVAMGPLRAGYGKYQTLLKRRVWNAEVSDRLEW